MFMEKIDLPRVTCDLFGVKSGFYGSGNGGSITGDKPRTATEDEARAYADFLRRKCGLPDLGKPAMHTATIGGGRGQRGHFHYVGATFGAVVSGGGWQGEAGNREYVPAQYEPGAFSVLFPGANQMRASVTMETLDDAGNVTSSQTMPVEPKKGGVVWSKDYIRQACGPVAKVKAARKAPIVAKRRAAPTCDKRRRAIMLALRLRKQLRISRDIAHDRLCQLAENSRQNAAKRAARPDAPAPAPDAILSDLAAAEALMRGEGYAPPADDTLREGLRIILHRGSYEGLRATVYSNGAGYGWGAVTDCGRHVSIASYGAPDRGWSPCPTVDEAAPVPTAIHRKRTPAHERAIRRAWAERKARRDARDVAQGYWQRWEEMRADRDRHAQETLNEIGGVMILKAKRRRAVLKAREAKRSARYFIRQSSAHYDRAINAEHEAREALAAREDLKRILADAEQRLAAAEAENAQLWAEIETLTAPAEVLAA